ncbi:MAG: hypothetical protein IJV00_07555 [Clostridia bacterium]|nr:hypothetical protein [Clostridia bacterium]
MNPDKAVVSDTSPKAPDGKKAPIVYLLRVSGMILLVFWGSSLLSPGSGFLTTLPLLTLFGAAAALLCFKPLPAAALGFVSAFFSGVISSLGLTKSALLGVSAFLGVTAAFWGVRLAAKAFRAKKALHKVLLAVCAVVLLLAAPAIRLFWYGTPRDNLAAGERFEKYLANKYPDQTFRSLKVVYSRPDGGYIATVGFGDADAPAEAELAQKDGGIADGFFESFTLAGRDRVQGELVKLIRSDFVSEDLYIACPSLDVGASDQESFSGSFGAAPEWIRSHAVFEIGFKTSLTGAADFSAKTKNYFEYILSSGFSFSRITFYGGDRGVYTWCATLYPDTDPETVGSLVRGCSRSMEIPQIELS